MTRPGLVLLAVACGRNVDRVAEEAQVYGAVIEAYGAPISVVDTTWDPGAYEDLGWGPGLGDFFTEELPGLSPGAWEDLLEVVGEVGPLAEPVATVRYDLVPSGSSAVDVGHLLVALSRVGFDGRYRHAAVATSWSCCTDVADLDQFGCMCGGVAVDVLAFEEGDWVWVEGTSWLLF